MFRRNAADACRIFTHSVAALASLIASLPALARTLEVGPNAPYHQPSAAIAAALPDDTIEIAPGTYFDCAVLSASRLTVIGKGPGVVLTDKTCEGKAIFITHGNEITIENITFARARVPDQNGAGIRVEGRDLTVVNCRFIDNEDGILAGDATGSRIIIRDSEFLDNGKCASECAHGIYVGHIALLRIENSRFSRTKEGHHVKSRALRTELVNDTITDGPEGTSSYLVDISNGGSLVMENNVLEKGPMSSNWSAAIVIGAEGVTQPTTELLIRNNRFTNDNEHATIFVRNLTATAASLIGNKFRGKVQPLSGDGSVR